MNSGEKRSHRLQLLLRYYLTNRPTDAEFFAKIKSLGVSDSTAKDYATTVKIQASRSKKK